MMNSQFNRRFAEQEPQEEHSAAGSVSVIDRHSHFDGLYRTARDLRIEGNFEGEIECEGTITVAEDAHLSAKVQARNVVISGSAEGEIRCSDRFTILPTGKMQGQVTAQSLVVEEGAFFEGRFAMTDDSSVTSDRPDDDLGSRKSSTSFSFDNWPSTSTEETEESEEEEVSTENG